MSQANPRILPGYRLSISFTLVYLSVLVIIPLGACVVTATQFSWDQFRTALWTEHAAYAFTFGASFALPTVFAVLTLLAVVTLLLKVRVEGRVKEQKTEGKSEPQMTQQDAD